MQQLDIFEKLLNLLLKGCEQLIKFIKLKSCDPDLGSKDVKLMFINLKSGESQLYKIYFLNQQIQNCFKNVIILFTYF